MVGIVEMARGKVGKNNHQTFACSLSKWNQLLAIAKSFGWLPKGAIHDSEMSKWTKDYDKYFENNYEPNEWAFCKKIGDVDSYNLASALIGAHQALIAGEVIILKNSSATIFKDNLSNSELEAINNDLLDLIPKFAHFASVGNFIFALDD